MLRLKRIKPQGSASRRKCRSSAVSFGPATPVMKARAVIGADYLAPLQRVDRRRRTAPSILLDDALAAGSLEATAQTIGLAGRGERPDHRAVEDTLGTEIGAPDGRLLTIEQMRVLRLQRADRGLRFGVALL